MPTFFFISLHPKLKEKTAYKTDEFEVLFKSGISYLFESIKKGYSDLQINLQRFLSKLRSGFFRIRILSHSNRSNTKKLSLFQ